MIKKTLPSMISAYAKAKVKKKHEIAACPTCSCNFQKVSYVHAFCSNEYSHPGGGDCKSTFWNLINTVAKSAE